uniref:Uncharacterized protein n=1 Tax=Parascaris equorum TaxID=6256 RepID=A0A914S0T1_PAREQ
MASFSFKRGHDPIIRQNAGKRNYFKSITHQTMLDS